MKKILLMGMIVLAVSNAAMAITVTNAGFEEPDMSGEATPYTFSSPPGWTGIGGVEETRDARFGTLIEGNQVAYINIGGTPGTTASATSDVVGQAVADNPYILTIAFAQRIKADGSAWDSNPDGEIGLLIDGVPIGTFTAYEGNSFPLGSFTDVTYTYTATAEDDGKDIQVQMNFTYDEQGATLGWQQAQFDNVRLEIGCVDLATLLAPSNGEIGVSIIPTFAWDAPCTFTVDSYDLEYRAADPNFVNGSVTVPTVTSPYTLETLLDYSTTYYWRIISKDATGTIATESSIGEFTTKPQDSLPIVDAGDNVLTTLELVSPPNSLAMGGSVTDDGTSTLTIDGWTAFEALSGGLTTKVSFADASDPATTVTISEPGTYILKLTATDANGSVSSQKEIEVFDSACDAAKATGQWEADVFDFDENCIVDLKDLATFAAEWLNSTALSEGWVYSGDFGDPANALIADYWTSLEGEDPNDLLAAEGYPDAPNGAYFVTDELRGLLSADAYGQRIYGYIVAPVTGDYTFYIASDDLSRLFLSSDTTPVDTNPALYNHIAEVVAWTEVDAWEAQEGQASTVISLTAGNYYYIEVLHKEDTGGDYVSVGWKMPGETTIDVIPGTALRIALP